MRKCKRMLSILLAMVMLSSGATCVFAEMEQAEVTPAVSVTEEDVRIADKLATIGITDPVEASELSNPITRGEMIPILLKYLRFDVVSAESATTPFLDISAFDPMIGGYSALYKAGYISGDDNKMYHPNDYLTYNEAVTMVINAMGYNMFAVRNGGYPAGYLYTANKYGMLEDLKGQGQMPIPYCDLFRIIDSSLEADAVVQRTFDANGNGTLELQKDVSVMEELHGIRFLEGIVTGNENTRLFASGSERISRYQIEIDGVVYDTPEQEYANFLGMAVNAYAEKAEDEYRIIYLEKDDINNVFTLQAEDLLPEKTTSSAIYYEDENDKEKHLNIDSADYTVIYNGKSYNAFGSLRDILPENGFIEGIDNTGDEIVDVLMVYELTNMVIGAVDRKNYKIYDKYTNEVLEADSVEDDVRIYDSEGNQINLNTLSEDDVISYTLTTGNTDYKLLIIYVCDKKVDGLITEITADDKILIDDTYYEMADNLIHYIEAGKLGALKAGVNGLFYLDRSGRIANYIRGESLGMTYAVVAGVDADDTLSGGLFLKLFTQDSEWRTLKAVSNVNIDGERINTTTDVGKREAANLIPLGEVIRFTEHNEEINYIDTAAMNKGIYSKAGDAGNLNLAASGSGFTTRYGMCTEYGDLSQNKFMINSETIIFETPSKEEMLEKTDEFAVVNSLVQNYYLPTNPGGWWQGVFDGYFVYNTFDTDIAVADCLLLRGSNSGRSSQKSEGGGNYEVTVGNFGSVALTARSHMGVVSKILSGMDEYGNEREKVYVQLNGTEKYALVGERIQYSKCKMNAYSATPVSFKDIGLEVGDVIQVGTDGDGYITQINVVYRANQEGEQAKNAWLTFPMYDMTYEQKGGEGAGVGFVHAVDVDNRILQVVMGTAENAETYDILASVATITVYDTKTKKSQTGTVYDLMKDDLVIVRSDVDYSARASQILVLR